MFLKNLKRQRIINRHLKLKVLTRSGGRDKIARINLDLLNKLLDSNKISSSEKINLEYLKKNKIISKSVTQFKVLGNGELNSKLNIEADFSSKSAIQKVEKAGGSILVKSNKD